MSVELRKELRKMGLAMPPLSLFQLDSTLLSSSSTTFLPTSSNIDTYVYSEVKIAFIIAQKEII